ncbi:hypothetical protein JHS3_25580 [Jeongeupia sp. HS-3]|uniref:pilus assembly PilX family protein n=1 Tax=Jeongeupia sp. HS-3 TaxID=1009682 RepID=UPI0018A344A9|nr:hypothetical protein [Jeongeupia sp. HS-3]BCL76822.1 hypothetical protein JHS3_25580 [Jeongeupia sp. HS-3]
MRHRIRSQLGVSVFIALISLLLMSLAGVALVRAVDSGSLMIGNLGFKEAATVSTDRATEQAIAWLQANLSTTSGSTPMLYQNHTADGYYATALDSLDPTGNRDNTGRVLIDWDDDGCASAAEGSFGGCIAPRAATATGGNDVAYLISRLCKEQSDPNATSCVKASAAAAGSSPKMGELKYGEDKRFSGSGGPHYRIIVRAKGPRNTVSFTETIVHF